MTKRPVPIIALMMTTINLFSQEESFPTQFIEEMESFQEEDGEQFDIENLYDIMNELKASKLDLNTATEDDFEQLPFLTTNDANNLVRHRTLYGKYQTLYELKHIPEFTQEKIEQLLPFVAIKERDKKVTFREMMRNNQSQIFIEADRYLQRKKGYEPDTSGTTAYAGSPLHYYAKYLFNTERLKASLVGEKDAGEAEWSEGNHCFDFVSASVEMDGTKWMKRLCIGDYKANFGQGLVVGTGSILGKNASVTNAYKNTQGLKRYASTGESDFFRGAGATLGWGAFQGTLFGSHKKGDATLKGEDIASFKTDGMHRTTLETGKKRNYTETIWGANLSFRHKKLTVGCSYLHYHYSRTLHPTGKTYTRFKLSDVASHWNGGVDYKIRFRHITLFGETAIDAKGHLATINGATILPLSRLEITLAQRHYQPEYQSNYAKGFGENSRIENEEGIYLSTRFSPFKRITIAAYADSYHFPWALYSTPTSSSGQELAVQANGKLNKRMDLTLKYKYKEKPEETNQKRTLRSTLNTQMRHWRFQTIAEGNRSDQTGEATTYGWIISQSISGSIRPLHLSTAFRYAYFHAEDYDNRIYIYEKDLPYTLSFPMHYGKGHRISVSIMWSHKEKLQIHAKVGWFIYTDGRENIGTGNEAMEGNISTQAKILMKITI